MQRMIIAESKWRPQNRDDLEAVVSIVMIIHFLYRTHHNPLRKVL
ncbi:MAG TPA: hypothetical protein VF762_16205 [Blastocatellia bacterium]